METCDSQYRNLLRTILDTGQRVRTRNADCTRLFGVRVVFDVTPLVLVRQTAWRHALRELEWVLSGSTNLADLHPDVRHWWRPWADESGEVRHAYGEQLRQFGAWDRLDQIRLLIDGVRDHPFSRRNVVTTWNPPEMTAPDCPITNCWGTVLQAFVNPDSNALSLVTYQRSADVVCGLPHNWIAAWAFLLWLASRTGRGVGSLTWLGGDVHVYAEHEELCREMLEAMQCGDTPELTCVPTAPEFRADDFHLAGYHGGVIRKVARMVV